MTPFVQHTLARSVSASGVGIHTGQSVLLTLGPAAADSGVTFVRTDLPAETATIRATAAAVCETRLGTVIANGQGASVSTIEHLMAVLHALGVDNARVEISGPELPIFDGSCAAFVALVDQAGRAPQAAPRRFIEVVEPVEVIEGDKRAALTPADRFELAFDIRFDSAAIGDQSVDLTVDERSFREDLAEARTFGFLHEVDAMRAAGLARGGSLDNVVVIDRDTVMNPEGLRRPDEFVRHKALDAIGDLYLLGGPLIGRYEGRYAGHGLNNALARALLARPRAWRLSQSGELPQAV